MYLFFSIIPFGWDQTADFISTTVSPTKFLFSLKKGIKISAIFFHRATNKENLIYFISAK